MMHLLAPLLTLVALACPSAASPAPRAASCPPKPFFILTGDSTTAVQSAGGGGWGNGFLSFLSAPAAGANLGHNGATTVSFVQGGDWARALALLDEKKAEGFAVWVTIQFGHNDQKPAKNISLAAYQANLERLAADVVSRGGQPVLLTPLTRRIFPADAPHEVVDSLGPQRQATVRAGRATDPRTPVLPLNTASRAYVNAIGDEAAQAYNLAPGDQTHLDDWGSVVFGRMVADLLLRRPGPAAACLRPWFRPDDALSDKIWTGQPA